MSDLLVQGTTNPLDITNHREKPPIGAGAKALRFAGMVIGPLAMAAAVAIVALQFFAFFLQTLMTSLQSDILAATAAVLTLYVGRSAFLGIRRFVAAKLK